MATRNARGQGPASARKPSMANATSARAWVGRYGGPEAERLDLGADLKLARAVERGLSTRALDAAVKGRILDAEDVNRLVITKRTLQRRRDDDERLNADESDKLTRVMRVIARAEVALGDSEKADAWMREPNRALEGRRPLDLLTSDVGARAVEKVLGRIEHGIFS